jgi:hypothetical protein
MPVRRMFRRAKEYSLPLHLAEHVSTVFNTLQAPPLLAQQQGARTVDKERGQAVRRESRQQQQQQRRGPGSQEEKGEVEGVEEDVGFKTTLRLGGSNQERHSSSIDTSNVDTTANSEETITIAFLNKLYQVPHNTGSARLSQAVFSTNDEHFSTNDLTRFQKANGLPQQSAVAYAGYSAVECTSGMSCTEGNLDMQYISGVAQQVLSVYGLSPSDAGQDPFVAWITDVADEANPPQSNSISWGSLENVSVLLSAQCVFVHVLDGII